jgi:hypothetical protein
VLDPERGEPPLGREAAGDAGGLGGGAVAEGVEGDGPPPPARSGEAAGEAVVVMEKEARPPGVAVGMGEGGGARPEGAVGEELRPVRISGEVGGQGVEEFRRPPDERAAEEPSQEGPG